MRSKRINYLVVGVFVLAMVAGVVVSVSVLSGRTGPTDTYYTTYHDATGLKFGSQVLYMGFPVGQVEEIRPEVVDGRLRFALTLSIREDFRDWRIPNDSVAEIRAAGLLAAMTIDIRAGDSAESLRPGDVIAGRERVDVFAAVSDTANAIREVTDQTVRPLLGRLNESVQTIGDAVERDGAPLLANLNRVAGELAVRGPEIIEQFLATAVELRGTSASLRTLLSEENTGKVGGIVDNVLEASVQLAGLAADARTQLQSLVGPPVVERVHGLVDRLEAAAGDVRGTTALARSRVETLLSEENLARLDATLADLRATAANLSAAATTGDRQLKRLLSDANLERVEAGSRARAARRSSLPTPSASSATASASSSAPTPRRESPPRWARRSARRTPRRSSRRD